MLFDYNFRDSLSKSDSSYKPENGFLLSLQKKSFHDFLYDRKEGYSNFYNLFKKTFDFSASQKKARVKFVDFRVEKPLISSDECKRKKLSYSCQIHIKVQMIYNVARDTESDYEEAITEQEFFLLSIPYITDSGSFVVNGCERVVVSQIVRSPGVFFVKNKEDNLDIYKSNIIPYQGSWMEILFDKKNTINLRIDKKKKIPVVYILKSMNMDDSDIMKEFYSSIDVSLNFTKDLYCIKKADLTDDFLMSYLPDDVLNADGEIVVKKNTFITDEVYSLIMESNDDNIYLSKSAPLIVFENITSEDGMCGLAMNEDRFDELKNKKIKSFKILNFFIKNLNLNIADQILFSKSDSYEDSLKIVLKSIGSYDNLNLEDSELYFKNLFFEGSYYSLSRVGRYKINESLNHDLKTQYLTKKDILAIIKKLIFLKESNENLDDIDSLSNRRIKLVGELIENQLRSSIYKLSRSITDKLSNSFAEIIQPADLFCSGKLSPNFILQKVIKDFFSTSQLSQFMDETNPLSCISHKRRISVYGPDGLKKDRVVNEIRDIHHTHYGRLCIIETPEGQNIGLISNYAYYSRINDYGFIETPYYKVKNRKITDEIVYLDANKELKHYICSSDSSSIKDGVILTDKIECRYNCDFISVESDKIEYVNVSPKQIVSVASSLIPFLECDYAKRSSMAANMQRQGVPLLNQKSPVIGTGVEWQVAKESNSVIISDVNGVVSFVDSTMIVVRSSEDQVSRIFYLKNYYKTNNETTISNFSLVNVNDIVKKGDIIADNSCTENGEIALGKSVLTAFMSYEGYNFEDSIVVSERLCKDDVFTSVHVTEYEVEVRDTRLGPEQCTRDIPGISDDKWRKLDESGVVNVGEHVESGDILVGKVTPKTEGPITSEDRLLMAIFGEKSANVMDSSLKVKSGISGIVIGVSILTSKGYKKNDRALEIEQDLVNKEKRIFAIMEKDLISLFSESIDAVLEIKSDSYPENIDALKKKFSNYRGKDSSIKNKIAKLQEDFNEAFLKIKNNFEKNVQNIIDGDNLAGNVISLIKVFVARKCKLQTGDKMAGRHGNKGVISKIVPVEDMPFISDGTPVDMILSPVGVVSRLNIGQILEVNLGLFSYGLGKLIDKQVEERQSRDQLLKTFQSCFISSDVLKNIKSLSKEDFDSFMKKISKDGMKLGVSVFESPKIEEIEKRLESVGFDKSGQVDLYDGKTGKKFDQPVTVGYKYMIKLHHMVINKIHARSIGPQSLVTQQPLQGKSSFGGQRIGEMECWALQAYGAAYILQEMLTIKSDDIYGRNRIYSSIIEGDMKFECSIPESFSLLFKELRSLGFNLVFTKNNLNPELTPESKEENS